MHVSVASNWRGLGLGRHLIERAVQELFRTRRIRLVLAHVKPENVGSVRAFEGAGFRRRGLVQIKGHQAMQLVLAHGEG